MTGSIKLWKQSILGGMAISLGCMVFLSVDNKYLGAFLFSIGLITICARGWALFTGKLCVTDFTDVDAVIDLILVWAGNFLGCCIMARLYDLITPNKDNLIALASGKLTKSALCVFIAGILCEFCIYIAVIGYKKIEADIGKYISIVLGVMVFILCGFEHCVADMFYMVANSINNLPLFITGIMMVIVATTGNVVGAIVLKVFLEKDTSRKEHAYRTK